MASIEKTVFISYRRKDISWALAVYQYLTKHNYDVFFDYTSIHSGDFEQVILGNIKARAHFIVILTPSALIRCNEPGDWLRREIETAISEKRNIIPLFFEGFNFGDSTISKKLTGKIGTIKKYNGLEVPSGYFGEAMERLRGMYLNVTLDAVLHPVSEEVQKAVIEQQAAANQAVLSKTEAENKVEKNIPVRKLNWLPFGVGGMFIFLSIFLIFGCTYLYKIVFPQEGSIPTRPVQVFASTNTAVIVKATETLPAPPQSASSSTFTPEPPTNSPLPIPTTISTPKSPTATPTFGIGSTQVSEKDGMEMVYVPAGEFVMGNNAEDAFVECQKFRSECQLDDFKNEAPPHVVYLDAFWIDQTEVTNFMYDKCVDSGVCDPPGLNSSFSYDSYYNNPENELFNPGGCWCSGQI